MPSDNQTDDLDPDSQDPPQREKPSQLRANLDAANARVHQLERENLLYKAGLGNLSDIRVTALLNTFGKDDQVTSETLKARATDLGFVQEQAPTDPAAPPPTPQGQQPAQTPPATPPAEPDPNASLRDASLSGLSDQEYAHVMSLRGGSPITTSEEFDRRMAAAKSQEEVMQIINTHGQSVGIMSEYNVD